MGIMEKKMEATMGFRVVRVTVVIPAIIRRLWVSRLGVCGPLLWGRLELGLGFRGLSL